MTAGNEHNPDPNALATAPAGDLSADWQREYMTSLRMQRARIPTKFAAKSFDNFVTGRRAAPRKALAAARDYVKTFSRKPNQHGILISGGVGCGKTHLAVAILKALVERGYTGLYFNVPDLLSTIRATYGPATERTERELLDEVNDPDLLVLDDVGSEVLSDYMRQMLYLIVNRRYEACKPVLITTNLGRDELEKHVGHRSYSRLCEMCHDFAEMPDDDYRKQHMK